MHKCWVSTCHLKDSEVPCPMFSPSLGWRQGWWGPAQFPKQGSRAGWVPQKDAGPCQGDISFLEHQDSDSMPLPILHHTVRWEQEAARRLNRRQQCLLQHTAPNTARSKSQTNTTGQWYKQSKQPVPAQQCHHAHPPASTGTTGQMCRSHGQQRHGCQVMDNC